MAAALLAVTATGADWPDYRGPGRRGVYSGAPLSAALLAASPEPAWTIEIGETFTAPAISDGTLFVRAGEWLATYDLDGNAAR